MSKGSGRRRISPADGIRYDPDTEMTNIEERGGAHYQSGSKEMRLGLRTGAQPTGGYYDRGRRWAGKGRKDDNRNWKGHTKGKQYEHNAQAQESKLFHRPVPEGLAARLRERSIAVLLHEARGRLQQRRKYTQQGFYKSNSWDSSYSSYRSKPQSEQRYPIGFAVFEAKVRRIELHLKYGF